MGIMKAACDFAEAGPTSHTACSFAFASDFAKAAPDTSAARHFHEASFFKNHCLVRECLP
jgi:hypothetical protein